MSRRLAIVLGTGSALLFFLSACGDPNKTDSLTRTRGAAPKPTASTTTDPEAAHVGQPGQIVLSGVIVKDAETAVYQEQIFVNIEGGNVDGKKVEVQTKPLLQTSADPARTTDAEKSKKLIVAGCTDEDLKALNLDSDLERSEVPETSQNDILKIEANTVALCGAAPLKQSQISIKADKLVLSGLILDKEINETQPAVVLTLWTNDLILKGSNQIKTSVKAGLKPTTLPILDLSVARQVREDGRLDLISRGADIAPESLASAPAGGSENPALDASGSEDDRSSAERGTVD